MTNVSLRLSLIKGFILILALVSQIAIAQQRKKKSTVTPSGDTIEISTLELRLIMDDYFRRFAGTVREAADSIMYFSDDYRIDNQALFWKMNAIPVAQGAIFSRDSFTAFIDILVFSYQMKLYFEKGAGKEVFGEHQGIAIRASDKLWKKLIDIGLYITHPKDISNGIQKIKDFAEQNPITSSYFNRKSTLALMASIQKEEKVKFKTLAEGMAQSLDELSTRINTYTEILPNQIRWQSEYLLNDILANSQLNDRIDTLTYLLERAVVLIESSPELIDNQTSKVLRDITGERRIVLEAIKQERMAVLEEIRNERAIVLQHLSNEMTIQREAGFKDLNALNNQGINLTLTNVKDIADLLFWRALLLISILAIVTFIGIFLYKKL
ncbi:MAG: hypothetical protein ABJJ25_11480 [Eudoraea sp.]|uniref:hypothetical protein n=1 Tax=Eudoraea sp. TaxID=1979955 RepID=UPI003267D39C